MKYALAFVLLLLGTPLEAQPSDQPSGTLYVRVDSSATIFINGEKLKTTKYGYEDLPVTLKPNDHIVAQLSNSKGDGSFALLYVALDRNSQIGFRAVAFKILPDATMTDFESDQFTSFAHQAVKRPGEEKTQARFPYKNNCEGCWGDRDECAIGTVITEDMFSPMQPQ